MSYLDKVLSEILTQTKVSSGALQEARDRRDLILDLTLKTYDGALKAVKSGSIAHRTTSLKLDDADASIVLDRRSHSSYGPDGDGDGPRVIVEDIADFLRPLVRQIYPNAMVSTSHKRAIYFRFRAPLDDDHSTDPTVDLVVGLTRKDQPGLWIPNMSRDIWQASDPAKHTELVLNLHKSSKGKSTKVVRLAKMYAKQWNDPELLPSFHLTAIMLETFNDELSLRDNLLALFTHAKRVLVKSNTPDPAGVSEPIKIPSGRDREDLVKKLDRVVKLLEEIKSLDENGADEAKIDNVISKIYWNDQMGEILLSALNHVKRNAINSAISRNKTTVVAVPSLSPRPVVNTRAYGGAAPRSAPVVANATRKLTQSRDSGIFELGIKESGYFLLWKSTDNLSTTYTFSIPIPTYQSVIVKIVVSNRSADVYAYGIPNLRHTYSNGSLCLYFPKDPAAHQWSYRRGLLSLLDLTKLHLYKELEFKRNGGIWLGMEVH